MKKIISVFLAVLMALTCMSLIAAAADEPQGYIEVHTVRVAPDSEGKIKIVGIERADNTVKHGETFYFTVEFVGRYRPDDSVIIKCYPASYMGDLVVTPEDTTEIKTLVPDSGGVYAISNVTEDYYVAVFNANTSTLSSLKQMLLTFAQALLDFFKRIFNR